MSFVIVLFPQPRALFINAGSHIFRLSGHGVEPATRTVDVPERPILKPFCVEFRKC
jgi:hypothetical protein